MTRLAIPFVSFLGSVGLGLALAYLAMVFMAFGLDRPGITAFLVGASDADISFGFLIFLVPYAFLMAHLWMSARLGAWLLERGEPELARRYAAKRRSANPLRGKKEALANHTVLVRVALREGELDQALDWIEQARPLATSGDSFSVEFHRWALEVALRKENLLLANDLVDELGVPREESANAAAFCAAASELNTRQKKESEAFEWIERAQFASSDEPRTRVARALATVAFRSDEESLEQALADLESRDELVIDVPGAAAEWGAVRAKVLSLLARPDESQAALKLAAEAPGDARARFVVEQIASRRSPNSGQEE